MSKYPDLPFVDDQDNIIGKGQLKYARENGIAVRIVRLFLTDEKGRILLQQRSASVNDPNTWDCSADGYVDVLQASTKQGSEDYIVALLRESQEELGINIKAEDLSEVAHYLFKPAVDHSGKVKDWTKVFMAQYIQEKQGKLSPEAEEVQALKWCSVQDAKELANKNPQNFEPGFSMALNRAFG
jgi:isopentenyldiphosphate isomerase